MFSFASTSRSPLPRPMRRWVQLLIVSPVNTGVSVPAALTHLTGRPLCLAAAGENPARTVVMLHLSQRIWQRRPGRRHQRSVTVFDDARDM